MTTFPRPITLSIDFMSAGAIVGAVAGTLPYWAAFAGLLWYLVQIWESKTVQKWRKVRRRRARMRRLALAAVDVQLAKEETAKPLDEPEGAP